MSGQQHICTIDYAVSCTECGLLDIRGTYHECESLAEDHEANHEPPAVVTADEAAPHSECGGTAAG